ncbi:alpha/beta hydrolase [Alteromonas macleodii]|uniref:alpha/beta hydrolase n=1 Tax=Alteromonas macleodii TaxID=28108 RepID=UPI00193094A6|nr:alpha/beta hydrolase [Alteromonas macleodii]
MTTVVFSHGKESGPWGSKITTLSNVASDMGFGVESIDYQALDCPEARLARLKEFIAEKCNDVVLVGSSMGGYVSLAAASQISARGVFLMAPALYLPNYEIQRFPYDGYVSLVHGWNDDIVPIENSLKYARHQKAQLLLLNDGHRLANSKSVISPFFRNWLEKFRY